jgi:hypothetical protein
MGQKQFGAGLGHGRRGVPAVIRATPGVVGDFDRGRPANVLLGPNKGIGAQVLLDARRLR